MQRPTLLHRGPPAGSLDGHLPPVIGQAEALSIQIKAAQVANLLVTGAVAVSQAGGTSYEAAAADVLARLVTEITNAASSPTAVLVTLNSPAVLTRVLSNVTTDLVELIVKGNTISATTLQNLYDFQKVVQDDLAQAAGLSTLTPQALQALDSLLGVISSGQKVVEMGLAPGSDTGADTTDLLTRLANPSIRVDLSSVKSVIAVGHVVELRIEGLALASAPVSPADLERGYLDFSVQNFASDGSKTLSVVITDPVSQKGLASSVILSSTLLCFPVSASDSSLFISFIAFIILTVLYMCVSNFVTPSQAGPHCFACHG